MLCSNCGKDIPFAGNVCPYCHTDKSADKDRHIKQQVQTMTGGACMLAGGVLGWFIFRDVGYTIISALVVGLIAAFVIVSYGDFNPPKDTKK